MKRGVLSPSFRVERPEGADKPRRSGGLPLVEKTFSTSGTARVKTLAVFVVLSPARTYRGQVRYVKGGLSPPFSCGMKLPI